MIFTQGDVAYVVPAMSDPKPAEQYWGDFVRVSCPSCGKGFYLDQRDLPKNFRADIVCIDCGALAVQGLQRPWRVK